MAFQSNTGYLYNFGDAGNVNQQQGMAHGTSPSIAALVGGGYEDAFQANNGLLYDLSSSGGPSQIPYGMAAGTSPSVASLTNGSFEIAFQANNGFLFTWSPSAGANEIPYGMAGGTSPSVTGLTNGSFEIAFQANNGFLFTWSPSAGANEIPYGMAGGTSPSVTGLANGSFEIAFQANDGLLFTAGNSAQNWEYGMAANTSPSIASFNNGNFEIAFQANTGVLWNVGAAGNGSTSQGMYGGTSPSIAASANSSYEIAFQANTGVLIEYGDVIAVNTGQGMYGGTSPAIAPDPPAPALSGTYPGDETNLYVDQSNENATQFVQTIESLGCDESGNAVSGVRDFILDFGAQLSNFTGSSDGWGAIDIARNQFPDADTNGTLSVESLATDFANGWRFCTSTLNAYIGIGTNNSGGSTVSSAGGQIWAGVVNSVILGQAGTNAHIYGANDIELDYSPFSNVKQWIGGSNPASRGAAGNAGFQTSGAPLYDYGDASGCAQTCDNGWTAAEVYNVAWGYAGELADPEIYLQATPSKSSTWTAVMNQGSQGTIMFSAVASEQAACIQNPGCNYTPYTPAQAWDELSGATGQTQMASGDFSDSFPPP